MAALKKHFLELFQSDQMLRIVVFRWTARGLALSPVMCRNNVQMRVHLGMFRGTQINSHISGIRNKGMLQNGGYDY